MLSNVEYRKGSLRYPISRGQGPGIGYQPAKVGLELGKGGFEKLLYPKI